MRRRRTAAVAVGVICAAVKACIYQCNRDCMVCFCGASTIALSPAWGCISNGRRHFLGLITALYFTFPFYFLTNNTVVTMAAEMAKEKEALVDTSIEDLEVAQALIAEPAYKMDSKPSPYKVCVSISSFLDFDAVTNSKSRLSQGRNGGVGRAMDVRSSQRNLSECTVPVHSPAPAQAKRRHLVGLVGWRRGNPGHSPWVLHGIQVPAPVQLRQVSMVVVVDG